MMDGYISDIDRIRSEEFPHLRGTAYLDHAGTALYPKSIIEAFTKDLLGNVYGNPHSASPSSQLTTRRVEDIRLRALQYFHADPAKFDLVFVANATAGIKLVAEAFQASEDGFWFGYHVSAHTSLVGARELAAKGHRCFVNNHELERWIGGEDKSAKGATSPGLRLIGFPAQSNMDGTRLPLSWSANLRSSAAARNEPALYTLLDAASLVSTSPLDLSSAQNAPDYTVVSFNKIFGFPDLGALIIRKDATPPLQKRRYFGGGTVEMVTCGKENWYIRKTGPFHEQLEDGTLPVHSILALDNAFDAFERIFGSIEQVSAHTTFLCQILYDKLVALRHPNGRPVCEIYNHSSSFHGSSSQGPIIALNIRNQDGQYHSNFEVEKLAGVKDIHLRSGGLCNPGGVASALGLEPWEMENNFSAGQRCGNDHDVIRGKPSGALRISLGATSNLSDIDRMARFVEEYFIDKSQDPVVLTTRRPPLFALYVEGLTVFPIKSCYGWPIPSTSSWKIHEEGLQWDREWCLVHHGTQQALSQKKYPRMALLRPQLQLRKGVLSIRFHGQLPDFVMAEVCVPLSEDPTVYADETLTNVNPKVCGEEVQMRIYAASKISDFFTAAVGTPCCLARMLPASPTSILSRRHAKLGDSGIPPPIGLSNESPILVITRSSINRLNEQIKLGNGKAAPAAVFRANILLAESACANPGAEQPYIEDGWRLLELGPADTSAVTTRLRVLGGCRRCQMVCIDQKTAEKNEEPFATLAKTRRRQGKVYFGIHTALTAEEGEQRKEGWIRVGDRVLAYSHES